MDEPDADRLKLIRNERTKIQANYANGIAIALLAIGTLTPVISTKPLPANPQDLVLQGAIGLVCLIGSVGLHLMANRILGDLR